MILVTFHPAKSSQNAVLDFATGNGTFWCAVLRWCRWRFKMKKVAGPMAGLWWCTTIHHVIVVYMGYRCVCPLSYMGLKAHVERLRWSCLAFWLVQLLQENMNLSTNLWSVRFHCFFRQQFPDLEHLIYSLLHLSLFKANLFVLQSPTFKQKAPACCLLRRASISRLGIVGQLRFLPRN